MTHLQPVPEQRAWTPQIFTNFTKFLKKGELLEKFEFWPREDSMSWKTKKLIASSPGQPHS